MWKFVYQFASPKLCYEWAGKLRPWAALLCLSFFIFGLLGGLVFAPPDYQQGEVYRIIYLHVPLAVWSLGVYMVMSVAAIIFFVWGIKVADVIAAVSAPVGAIFTGLTLLTGAIWGKPTWGAWWIWDARLTSELILLMIYLGIIALRSTVPDTSAAARICGVMTLVGLVNIPIIHYSVNWWHTLHQGATVFKWGMPSIASSMLYPLLSMVIALMWYYFWICLVKIRSELLQREQHTGWVKEIVLRGQTG